MYVKLELTNRQHQELKNVAWREKKAVKVVVCEMILEFAKQVEKHGWDYFKELRADYTNHESMRDYCRTEGITIPWETERIVLDYADRYRVFQHTPIDVAVAYCVYAKTNPRQLSYYGQKKWEREYELRYAINALNRYPELKDAAERTFTFLKELESMSEEDFETKYIPNVSSSGEEHEHIGP